MGSLLEDLQDWYKDEHYPPDGVEFDNPTEQVSWRIVDDSPRWGDTVQIVYRRGDELVAVEDVQPATEMQNWGDYGDPEIYPVEPYVVTETNYRRVW